VERKSKLENSNYRETQIILREEKLKKSLGEVEIG
jgi:hypothetical protein